MMYVTDIKPRKRVNCYLDYDVVDAIDNFAKFHSMSRGSAISVLCINSLNANFILPDSSKK